MSKLKQAKKEYAQSAIDSGIFSIEEEDDGTFTIHKSDGQVFESDFISYDEAFDFLVSTVQEDVL